MSETNPSYKEVLDAVSTLCAEYETEDGIIRCPGKYEGEHVTTPYVHNLIDCGFAGEAAIVDYSRDVDTCGEPDAEWFVPYITEIDLTETEQSILMTDRWIYFYEDVMGFAYSIGFMERKKVFADVDVDNIHWTFVDYNA